MKYSKVRAALLGTVLAAAMTAAPVMAGEPTLDTGKVTELKVKKTVTVENGVTIPGNVTFKIESADNADGVTTPTNKIPANITINFNNTKTNKGDATTKDFTGTFTMPDFSAADAGEYTWKVTEDRNSLTNTPGTWTVVDTNDYYIHAYVDNTGNATYKITADNTKGQAEKLDEMDFSNTYVNNTANLKVTKDVQNKTYANPNATYAVTVTFTLPATSSEATITVPTGNGVTDASVSGTTVTFNIKDGATATFANLPAGTTYSVSETIPQDANYTASYKTVENGGAEATADTVSGALIGEGENKTTVVNTYKDVTMTGVVTSIAPFLALIAVAVAAIVAYLAMKKKIAR